MRAQLRAWRCGLATEARSGGGVGLGESLAAKRTIRSRRRGPVRVWSRLRRGRKQGEASPFYRLKNGSSSLQTEDERKIMALRACLDKKFLVFRLKSLVSRLSSLV